MFEHQIINDYFLSKAVNRPDVRVGIGDDCAIVDIPADKELVLTTDMFIAGIHFPYPAKAVNTECLDCFTAISNPQITPAYDIGYKAAAVNLSDIAAMGAEPTWVTLSLAMPAVNPHWLDEFSHGFMELLNQYNVALVGGDLSRGPLSVTVQAHGLVDKGHALLRSTAQPGDIVFVSGELGSAAYALHLIQHEGDITLLREVLPALTHPQPRIELGLALLGIASAAMDLSDGLASDLARLQTASQCGSKIDLEKLPINPLLLENLTTKCYNFAFSGGDDYELCFTVPANKVEQVNALSQLLNLPLTAIGEITQTSGTQILNGVEKHAKLKASGFEHFKG